MPSPFALTLPLFEWSGRGADHRLGALESGSQAGCQPKGGDDDGDDGGDDAGDGRANASVNRRA